MKKVKICCDSTCDLSPELIERYDIGIIPLYVNFPSKSYKDGVDINVDKMFDIVKSTKTTPKTSAPPPEDYKKFYKQFIDEGYEIVHLCIGQSLSCSYQNACIAAKKLEGVYPIDSLSLSTAMGLLAIKARELADEGKSAKEIFDYIESVKAEQSVLFIIDTLDFAVKGGRCNMLTAWGANFLRLKPCFMMKNGVLSVTKKFRGSFNHVALEYAKFVLAIKNIDYSKVFISYTQMSKDLLDKVVATIKSLADFKEIFVTQTGCTIATHGGPNTLAIFYMVK